MAMVLLTQMWMRGVLQKLAQTEEGQDMIEYALLLTVITIPLIVAIMAIGPFIESSFQDVANGLVAAHT